MNPESVKISEVGFTCDKITPEISGLLEELVLDGYQVSVRPAVKSPQTLCPWDAAVSRKGDFLILSGGAGPSGYGHCEVSVPFATGAADYVVTVLVDSAWAGDHGRFLCRRRFPQAVYDLADPNWSSAPEEAVVPEVETPAPSPRRFSPEMDRLRKLRELRVMSALSSALNQMQTLRAMGSYDVEEQKDLDAAFSQIEEAAMYTEFCFVNSDSGFGVENERAS